ncbi:hypothetical protein C1A50_5226 [Paenibacillus polymyxa]|nr:hypothetical protein C1A50_5226 [Paenibacillus polymyxa]
MALKTQQMRTFAKYPGWVVVYLKKSWLKCYTPKASFYLA